MDNRAIQAARELASRKCEALRIFRALPHQENFFSCKSREVVVRGGNRCQPKETVVWLPNGSPSSLGEIQVGDTVLGVNENRRIVPSTVLEKREFSETSYRLTTKRGYETHGTFDHPVLSCDGWTQLKDLTDDHHVHLCDKVEIYRDRVREVKKDEVKDFVGITTSTETYIGDGFVSHNSGKSICSAVWFAAMAMDRPVYDHMGQEIEVRREDQKNRPLLMWCIGLGQSHIGQTLYRLLFRPGAFQMVRGKDGSWRTWRPWGDDASSPDPPLQRPAPPLIPPRYIKPGSFSYENKSERVFTKVEIINPATKETTAEIYAFTSSGDVKAGDPVDVIWVDEAIKFPSHYPEWQARLIDKKGRLVWSSWPDITNNALMQLTDRAENYKDWEGPDDPPVKEFIWSMMENPYIDDSDKALAKEGWTAEETRSRVYGEYITDSLLMYPNFSEDIHSAIVDSGEDEVSKILRRRGGEPPPEWTRELVLDPGTSHPAVGFFAVPPPDLGDYRIVYDEICIPRLDADQLASKVLAKSSGYIFERFIIDWNAGRQTAMGFGKTVAANYTRAFEEKSLTCRQSGSHFTPGGNDVGARISILQSWLKVGKSGFPKLRIVTHRCPNIIRQLKTYRKRMTRGLIDEYIPAPGQKIDAAVTLEYWASRSPEWRSVPGYEANASEMQRYYGWLKKKYGKNKKTPNSINLGPVSSFD